MKGWGYYGTLLDNYGVGHCQITDLPNSKVDGNTNPRPIALFPVYPEEKQRAI